ncbi:hypothetical protein [Echinicola vietnamensis]|uniref:Uncharacterized protein n=1 Tax=Echinicola vietnamensis (strain DSM 17526 / LMG 23754 / KMM 6221) TaxID=926556 RepID=L0G2P7_ECHVK|nr:hypothetical protein [Echinicola vietnamensis]AGA79271.1 hypothetical protein Echvi_3033 [Echinicola vietnamensis DSM 17526]
MRCKSVFKSFISSLHDLKVYDAYVFGYEVGFSAKLGFIQFIDEIASFQIKLPSEILLDPFSFFYDLVCWKVTTGFGVILSKFW